MKAKLAQPKQSQIEWVNKSCLLAYFLAIFLVNIQLRFLSLFATTKEGHPNYLMSKSLAFIAVGITFFLVTLGFVMSKYLNDKAFAKEILKTSVLALISSAICSFYCDVLFMMRLGELTQNPSLLNVSVPQYLSQEAWFYCVLAVLLIMSIIMDHYVYPKLKQSKNKITRQGRRVLVQMSWLTGFALIFLYSLPLLNLILFYRVHSANFIDFSKTTNLFFMLLYSVGMLGLLLYSLYQRKQNRLNFKEHKKIVSFFCISTSLTFLYQMMYLFVPVKIMSEQIGMSSYQIINEALKRIESNIAESLVACGLFILALLLQKMIKSQQASEMEKVDETTGQFGSADWATYQDLEKWDYLNKENGILTGLDEQGNSIYVPLSNKLTIAPQGLGKTTSSAIPVLLTHNGPVFVFDTKGELWAVTARYRSEVLGREVIVLDPFNITEGADFKKNRTDASFKKHTINPFDWIPEDPEERHRMLNAFAAALVINEGGFATHFDENAKILIRGFIDYIMSFKREDRKLHLLHQLMCEPPDEAKITLEQMVLLEGRAGAAANQINRVGTDERGSILSTTYRQIDWMGDINIQKTLLESNFDLTDFLKGNMDIYVVLPEDQVKEHSRLFRMMMCLLMTLIVQANPSDLPKQKILFLLEELAQLGASPDVEQCIEVLRARGVVIWSVFQTLSQINMFSKPDLFKTKPIKQIFTNDDPDTMEWIQKLGGDKTIRTKSFSTNTGSSKQWMQLNRGSSSTGEGESIHETGVKLIQTNEIRELLADQQFVFLQGKKPLKCKKTPYFAHADFNGKYDNNPLEVGEINEA